MTFHCMLQVTLYHIYIEFKVTVSNMYFLYICIIHCNIKDWSQFFHCLWIKHVWSIWLMYGYHLLPMKSIHWPNWPNMLSREVLFYDMIFIKRKSYYCTYGLFGLNVIFSCLKFEEFSMLFNYIRIMQLPNFYILVKNIIS